MAPLFWFFLPRSFSLKNNGCPFFPRSFGVQKVLKYQKHGKKGVFWLPKIKCHK
jgi:hypothetical protein